MPPETEKQHGGAAADETAGSTWTHLEVELDDDGIATIVIQRPKALNALNIELLEELEEAMEALVSVEEVRVILITGGGDKAFVAGADISEMADLGPMEARDFSHLGQSVFSRVENCPRPVIAVINGFALGGGLELAMACHLRVASTSAKLGLPEVGLGLIPGFGGTQRLARLAGTGIAREWILTGDPVSAQEAHRVGVVNRLAEPAQLMQTAHELAAKIATRGPAALHLALESIRRGLEAGQEEGEAAESDAFGLIFSTEDAKEGMKAFLEKRKPDFKGF